MTKIQTILSLLLLLVIIFSMDMNFGNPIRESFSNKNMLPDYINVSIPSDEIKLTNDSIIRNHIRNKNIRYSGSGFLGETLPYPKGDDQPLFFGFSSQ